MNPEHIDKVRVPNRNSRVWKEECAFTFANQDGDEGILVDMTSWVGFSPAYALQNYNHTKHPLYLRIKRTRVPKAASEQKPITSVASAVLASMEDTFETKYNYEIVVLPSNQKFPYPDPTLPPKVREAAEAIINANSQEHKEAVKPIDGTLKESNVAKNLVQLQNGKRIPHEGWKCDACAGDATTNLWLNLTDGHIGCGRKNADGTGGQGHAEAHFHATGFPLVAKLGTITGDGDADVWSYTEGDMVIDPLLTLHLAHWGLDVKKLKKTDKTVAELELEHNMNFDWSRIQEKDKELIPLYGPGFTGLQNLGNTCYMASVLQVTFKIPEFVDRYYKQLQQIINQTDFTDAPRDFHLQMAKVGYGLLSGEYSTPPPKEEPSSSSPLTPDSSKIQVKPAMLKALLGEGHPEFSTSRQQDAVEFFQFLMQNVERKEKAKGGGNDPSHVFKFSLEERIQCSASNKVKYLNNPHEMLQLSIPIEKATNLAEVEEYNKRIAIKLQQQKEKGETKKEDMEVPIWPKVSLRDCFASWGETEAIADYYSTAIKAKTTALKRKRFLTFPKYLVLHMGRFVLKNGQFGKLEAFLDVPEYLDLSEYSTKGGLQPGEELLPESDTVQIQFNEGVIASLMGMGFSRTKAEHAAYNTQGQGADAAAEWLFSRMDDDSLEKPLVVKKAASSASSPSVNAEDVDNLMGMGFSKSLCVKALSNTQGNVERAVDWLFSHQSEDTMEEDPAPKQNEQNTLPSSSGRYKLFAFITHMGKNTDSGHYVAHIKVPVNGEEKWVIYNDSKVALSQDPPKDLAYIYFYRSAD